MGVWTDNFAGDDYNSVSPEERKARREKYLNYMQEYYSPAEIEDTLVKNGAYDKEKQAEQSAEAPSGLFDKGRGAIQNQQSMSGQKVFNPNLVDNNAKSQEELVKEAMVFAYPDSQAGLDAAAQEQIDNPTSFQKGYRESNFGTAFLDTIPPEKRQAAIDAINRSRATYDAQHKDRSWIEGVGDKTAEGLGTMAGSATTYAMAPAAAGLGLLGLGAKGTMLASAAGFGAMQTGDEIAANSRLGNDTPIVKSLVVNTSAGLIPGVTGQMAKSVVGGSEKAAVRALSTPAAMTTYAATDFMQRSAHDAIQKITGKDDRTWSQIFKDNSEGAVAGSVSSLPLTARSHIDAVAKRMSKEFKSDPTETKSTLLSFIDTQNEIARKQQAFEILPVPEIEKSNRVNIVAYREALQTLDPHHQATTDLQNNVAGKTRNAAWGNMVEGLGEKQYKALSTLESWGRAEKQVMTDRMVAIEKAKPENAGKFNEKEFRALVEDRFNKGEIVAPISERARKAFIAEPTQNQTAIHDANDATTKVYKGLSTERSVLLDNYLIMKCLRSSVDRKKAALEREKAMMEDPGQMGLFDKEKREKPAYFLPKGITEEKIDTIIRGVESDPANRDVIEKAKTVWGLYKGMIERDYRAGKLSDESYRNLMEVEHYVPLSHIPEKNAFRSKELSKKTSGEGDTFQFLRDGSSQPLDMNAGKLLHQSLVRSRMTELKHERIGMLYDMAVTGKFDGLRLGEKVAGEDTIPYIKNGEKVNIIVPDWFKSSLEKNGLDGTSSVMKVLGVCSGVTPLKTLAVHWNPEFAIGNYPRDFGRYYRLMAIAADPSHSVPRRFLIDNNPIKYAKDMFKAQKDVIQNWDAIYELGMRNTALRGRMTMDYEGNRFASKKDRAVRSWSETIGWLGAKSEDLQRLACFKMLMDKGFTPERAGEITGEFLDYNRKGTATAAIDQIIPFFNVAIQAPRADWRVAKQRPADYGMRIGWGVMSFFGMTMLGYALTRGKAEAETEARTRANTIRLAIPGRNSKGGFTQLQIALDQQDRLPAAIGDAFARMAYGMPLDLERMKNAGWDYLSVPMPGDGAMNWLPPLPKAAAALGGFLTVDPYTKRPISNLRPAMEGNRYKNTDGSESQASVILSHALKQIGLADWQPAAVDFAFKTVFPLGFMQNTANFVASAFNGDVDPLKAPMIRKFVRRTNPNLPIQEAADKGAKMKESVNIDRMKERSEEKNVTDPKEYLSHMRAKIAATTDPFEKKRLADETKQGYRDRFTGMTPQFQYYKNKVDPSQYEALDRVLRQQGKEGLSDQPFAIKQRAREQMYGSSEQ